MDSNKYIGMDVHQATILLAVLNSAGKLLMESIIETNRNQSGNDCGVPARATRERVRDLRGRNLCLLVVRPAEASCHESGGVRSAEERPVERGETRMTGWMLASWPICCAAGFSRRSTMERVGYARCGSWPGVTWRSPKISARS